MYRWSNVRFFNSDTAEISQIRLLCSCRFIRLFNSATGEMSVIWLLYRLSNVNFVNPDIAVMSLIRLLSSRNDPRFFKFDKGDRSVTWCARLSVCKNLNSNKGNMSATRLFARLSVCRNFNSDNSEISLILFSDRSRFFRKVACSSPVRSSMPRSLAKRPTRDNMFVGVGSTIPKCSSTATFKSGSAK